MTRDDDEMMLSLLVLYSNFIGVKWEKEALVPRVGCIVRPCVRASYRASASASG